mgnify:CR=1 FL=1
MTETQDGGRHQKCDCERAGADRTSFVGDCGCPRPGDTLGVGGAHATILRPWVRPTKRAFYIGLSGGIGSGKSTVARVWEHAGALVLSADAIAREIVEPGTPGLSEIAQRFGAGILADDGSLDRAALGAVVFSSRDAREALESITHPRIAQRVQERRRQVSPSSIVVYDVPLLVESNMVNEFDCVVMVQAHLADRITRLEQRGLDRTSAASRIDAQAGDEERLEVANISIANHGSHSEMSELASRVFDTWLACHNLNISQ